MSNIHVFLILLTLLALPVSFITKSHAATVKHSYIENFAKQYLEEKLDTSPTKKLTIEVTKIDPRIKLQNCESHFEADIPENFTGRNINIKITCADSAPWHIYLTAKITTVIPVLVAKKSINKGNLLDESNMKITYLDTYKIRGSFIEDISKVSGTKAKRRISKNRLITLKNTCTVCKGSQVAIIAQSKNFTIKTNGEALDSGNVGEQISVKNKRSGKVITAKVKAINKVVINL
jgi:flagella basal body P-ring formation protein FlgA